MFEFAIYTGVILIGAMTGTHYYFAGKIKSKINDAEEEYCKEAARFVIEGIKHLIESYSGKPTPEPPYTELETFYVSLYRKEFKMIDNVVRAMAPERWLKDALTSFATAIVLFLFAGLFPYVDLVGYSIPSFIVGVILVIVAVARIWQISRTVLL